MKKIISCISLIALTFSTMLVGACTPRDNVVRVNEVTHSVFYAPFYIAIENGYFEEVGIEIELTNGGGSDASMTALISGGADIGLMGPETSVYVYNEGRQDYAIIFGQLTRKDGSFLVGREPIENFSWSMLENKEIIGGRKGGSPAMALEYALKKNNLIDKSNVTINYDVKYDLITAAFEGGTGDFCTMFEPAASNFQAQGKGYIIASVGEESGDMPFTCFMATKSYLNANSQKVQNFLSAIQKGMDFLWQNNAVVVANAIKNQFADTSVEMLSDAIQNYKNINAYMTNPYMKEEDFEHLQDVIIDAGVMTKRASYSHIVDNSFALNLVG